MSRRTASVRAPAVLFASALAVLSASCSEDTTAPAPPPQPKARIFATVSSVGEVWVIADDTHAVTNKIAVGKGPAIILETPDHKKLYTANWADNSISVIDVATETFKPIAMRGRPYVIAMAPDGKRLYAGISTVNEIAVINTETDSVETAFSSDGLPASIVVSADGGTLFVAKLSTDLIPTGPGTLEAVSATTGAVVKDKLTVGGAPAWITIGRDGSRVYTLNFTTDDITVVDTVSWAIVTTIATGAGSQGIIGSVTPDGSALYVTNHGTADMIAIDTSTNLITKTIPLDGLPVGVSFSADGKQVYTTDFGPDSKTESPLTGLNYLLTGKYEGTGSGTVRVFDVATNLPVGTSVTTAPGATSVVVVPPIAVDVKKMP